MSLDTLELNGKIRDSEKELNEFLSIEKGALESLEELEHILKIVTKYGPDEVLMKMGDPLDELKEKGITPSVEGLGDVIVDIIKGIGRLLKKIALAILKLFGLYSDKVEKEKDRYKENKKTYSSSSSSSSSTKKPDTFDEKAKKLHLSIPKYITDLNGYSNVVTKHIDAVTKLSHIDNKGIGFNTSIGLHYFDEAITKESLKETMISISGGLKDNKQILISLGYDVDIDENNFRIFKNSEKNQSQQISLFDALKNTNSYEINAKGLSLNLHSSFVDSADVHMKKLADICTRFSDSIEKGMFKSAEDDNLESIKLKLRMLKAIVAMETLRCKMMYDIYYKGFHFHNNVVELYNKAAA